MVSTRPRARPAGETGSHHCRGVRAGAHMCSGVGRRELTHAHTAEGAGSELVHRRAVGGGRADARARAAEGAGSELAHTRAAVGAEGADAPASDPGHFTCDT